MHYLIDGYNLLHHVGPASVSADRQPTADDLPADATERARGLQSWAHALEGRRLGLPSYTRADLERLFAVLDAPAPPREWPANVIPLPPHRPVRTGRDRRR